MYLEYMSAYILKLFAALWPHKESSSGLNDSSWDDSLICNKLDVT